MKTKLFYKCAADADLIAPTEKDEDDFFCLLANVFAPFFFFFEMKMILLYVRLYVLLIIHFALANAICKADLISFKKKKEDLMKTRSWKKRKIFCLPPTSEHELCKSLLPRSNEKRWGKSAIKMASHEKLYI